MSESRELPSVDFSSFIVSLASSAMASLGKGPDPQVDLDVARHSIDLLRLLEAKTKGNLDDDERKLLETVLYETQLTFVETQKNP